MDWNSFEAERALPDEAVLGALLIAEAHFVDDAEGALAPTVHKTVHAHGVKHLDVRLDQNALHLSKNEAA